MSPSLLESLARRSKDPRTLALLVAPLAVLGLTWGLGGVAPGLPFLALLAVLAAGRWFGTLVGGLQGLYTALLLGPWVGGIQVTAPRSVHGPAWGPGLFFIVTGIVAGAATQQLRRRLAEERSQRRELARVHARTLVTFAALVAHRDQPTAFHCERVAENARTLGRLYGLSGHELNALYWAGMLHDLGKIATPAAILLKEGKLTAEEYDAIQRHAAMGADVLLDISPRFQLIAEGVASHHERWDGSGYPAGLAGDAIPLFGRLLAVVDVFEAMTAPRPYREALPQGEVMQHLRERAGTDFDPAIVKLFAQLYRQGLVHTHANGDPPPADPSSGIFSTGFWREQGRIDTEGVRPAVPVVID